MKYTDYYNHLNELLSKEQNIVLKDFYVFVRDILLDLKNQAESHFINASNWEEKYKSGRFQKFFFKEYHPINGVKQESFREKYILFVPLKDKFKKTFPHVTGLSHNIGFPIDITFEGNTIAPVSVYISREKTEVHGLQINFGFLLSDNNFTNALQHEIQHIADADGANPEDDSQLSHIKYYLNTGEIQAHAKQLAYLYHKRFPQDTKINYSKFLKSFNNKDTDPNFNALTLYLFVFASYKYAKYEFPRIKFDQALVDKMRAAHNDFVREMTRSLNYFIRVDTLPMNENLIKRIDIENLLPDKKNMEVAVDSLRKGMYSPSNKPIEVYASEDKYIVADGHHRLLQAIINGESSVAVKILDSDKPMSRNGTIELDLYDGDYYGLDNNLENGWLIKRL